MAFTSVIYAPSGCPNKSTNENYSKMKFSRGRKGGGMGGWRGGRIEKVRPEISPASPLLCSLYINACGVLQKGAFVSLHQGRGLQHLRANNLCIKRCGLINQANNNVKIGL